MNRLHGWRVLALAVTSYALVSGLAASPRASAQGCSPLLSNYGVWETGVTRSSQTIARSFMNWFCSSPLKDGGETHKVLGGLKGYALDLNSHGESDWSKYSKQELCRRNEGKYAPKGEVANYANYVSPLIEDALKACTEKEGLYGQVVFSDSPLRFYIDLLYKPERLGYTALIKAIQVRPDAEADCDLRGDSPEEGLVESRAIIGCVRMTNRPVEVKVDSIPAIRPSSVFKIPAAEGVEVSSGASRITKEPNVCLGAAGKDCWKKSLKKESHFDIDIPAKSVVERIIATAHSGTDPNQAGELLVLPKDEAWTIQQPVLPAPAKDYILDLGPKTKTERLRFKSRRPDKNLHLQKVTVFYRPED